MSDQAFVHPQQVRDLLAATIGNDVFEEIAKQDPASRAGNPLPPPPADPAPAPAVPSAAPQADPASVPAPVADTAPIPDGQPAGRKLVLGKYGSEKEAEDAYHRLLHTNKELMRRLDAATGQQAVLEQPAPRQPEAAQTPRVEPAVRSAAREEAMKTWQEKYGVAPEDLDALKVIAREAVLEEVGPEREYRKADQFMSERYPESMQFREEVTQFVQTDPETGEFVRSAWERGDYKAAMEYAWMKYNLNVRTATERAMLANDAVRQQEVEAARKDAGLISSQVSGVHETTKQYGPTKEEMARLENLHRAGHKEPWLRATIGATLPDELFGIGQ